MESSGRLRGCLGYILSANETNHLLEIGDVNIYVCVFFVFELCSAFVIALGEFQMMHSKFSTLSITFWPIYPANTLVVTGTIAACVCYIGVFGGMRENRCMLISVSMKPLKPLLNMNNNNINIIIYPDPNKSMLHFLFRQ